MKTIYPILICLSPAGFNPLGQNREPQAERTLYLY
jgi:hypothetical protein